VYSHGARLTGDRSTAEDVVSLTFLEAWRLRTKLLPDAEFSDGTGDGLRPWLFGIATNLLRNKTPNDSQPPVQHSGIYAGRSGTSSHCASGRG
jgi:DNA-directed RNA polymerase specialized sigma24 family protein